MFLGIDVGTSGVKAVILGDDGRVLDSASAPLDVQTPAPLWSEQDPDQWWAATGSAIRKMSPKLREAVMAIGLSGQMHGATLLVVCLQQSGLVFELVAAPIQELRHGQESEA
ncbi:MAG: FGGY family carbohydrate kinase [Pseudomonadota bacterium]